jgi:hypothetical protein
MTGCHGFSYLTSSFHEHFNAVKISQFTSTGNTDMLAAMIQNNENFTVYKNWKY